MIFLDNASTTRVFDEVLNTMSDINSMFFYNPSALYGKALDVKNLMDESRKSLAERLNAQKNELFFTSCATEANNWILNSGFKNKKGNIVISAGEHASVYDCAMSLKNKGFDVRIAALTREGTLDLDDLERKLDNDTSLVSIIHVSNETGVVGDIENIVKIIRKKSLDALIHSDGVQAFCKTKTDVKKLGVDFYTVSAHKIGGPKGVGAIYINKNIKIAPLLYGGGQESGLRSGTENVPAIVGFARAAEVFEKKYDKNKTTAVFEYLKNSLTCGENGQIANDYCRDFEVVKLDGGNSIDGNGGKNYDECCDNNKGSKIDCDACGSDCCTKTAQSESKQIGGRGDGFIYNGAPQHSGFILSLSYPGIKSEILQHILSDDGILIGLGSACSSKLAENRVLSAMGRGKKEIEGNIRLSFSVDTTLGEAHIAAEKIKRALFALKEKTSKK